MKYFNDDEFKCRCGCGMDVTDELKQTADDLRELAGVPFIITSGARCEAHNIAVRGKPNSAHTRGLAFDVKYQSSAVAFKIESACYAYGIKRIGRNQKKMFIHIDIDESLDQNVSFPY